MRIKPYYMYQMDLISGGDHFITPVQTGLDIIDSLWGHTSDFCVPHYVIDAPSGGGKISIMPNPIISFDDQKVILENFEGNTYMYPNMSQTQLKGFHNDRRNISKQQMSS